MTLWEDSTRCTQEEWSYGSCSLISSVLYSTMLSTCPQVQLCSCQSTWIIAAWITWPANFCRSSQIGRALNKNGCGFCFETSFLNFYICHCKLWKWCAPQPQDMNRDTFVRVSMSESYSLSKKYANSSWRGADMKKSTIIFGIKLWLKWFRVREQIVSKVTFNP